MQLDLTLVEEHERDVVGFRGLAGRLRAFQEMEQKKTQRIVGGSPTKAQGSTVREFPICDQSIQRCYPGQ